MTTAAGQSVSSLATLKAGADFSWVPLTELKHWRKNPRSHVRSMPRVIASIKRFGFVAPVVAWPSRQQIVAGHGRTKGLEAILKGEPSFVPKGAPGPGLVPVRLFEFANDAEAEAYALADNRTCELSEYDEPALADVLESLHREDPELCLLAGWTEDEREAVNRRAAKQNGQHLDEEEDESSPLVNAEKMLERWPVEPGQLWIIDSLKAPGQEHRLICADSTDGAAAKRLIGKERPRVVLTDPPFCSGGFQEAQKSRGSGNGRMSIANDNLSTEGYQNLIQAVFEVYRPEAAYVFTDWRMWGPLSKAMETKGMPARNMLVWDKETPGLGQLWRTQHELIMFVCRSSSKRIKGVAATGNVLQCKRTGNILHETEKPVDLLQQLLAGDSACERKRCPVFDTFGGSGSTMVAAELEGRVARLSELSPAYCAVILDRMSGLGCTPRLAA